MVAYRTHEFHCPWPCKNIETNITNQSSAIQFQCHLSPAYSIVVIPQSSTDNIQPDDSLTTALFTLSSLIPARLCLATDKTSDPFHGSDSFRPLCMLFIVFQFGSLPSNLISAHFEFVLLMFFFSLLLVCAILTTCMFFLRGESQRWFGVPCCFLLTPLQGLEPRLLHLPPHRLRHPSFGPRPWIGSY